VPSIATKYRFLSLRLNAVLFMILGSNALVIQSRDLLTKRLNPLFAGLLISLLLSYLMPIDKLLNISNGYTGASC